jgi:hypothetical protein
VRLPRIEVMGMAVDPEVLGCVLALLFVTVGRVMWMGPLLEGNRIGEIESWGRDEVMWNALRVVGNADGPVMRDGLRSELMEST